MKRVLQRINFIANTGIFLCAAASFFFITYEPYQDMDVISLVASISFIIFSFAIFVHGVILPDREVQLGEKRSRILRIIMLIGILFTDDKIEHANNYVDLSADKVYRRSWNPGSMFAILVVGSFLFFPALLINQDRYYRLCMLGVGFFFLVLFILSFFYEYYDSRENGNNRSIKTAKGIIIMFLVVCVIAYAASFMHAQDSQPFGNIRKQVKQWEDFKAKQQMVYGNEVDKDILNGFTDIEMDTIVDMLHEKYGTGMVYKVAQSKFIEKDEKARYYSEVTLVVSDNSSDDVFIHIFRKYLSDNDEYKKGEIIPYISFISNEVKKEDAFSE